VAEATEQVTHLGADTHRADSAPIPDAPPLIEQGARRDEGHPSGPGEQMHLGDRIYGLLFLHAHTWQRRPEPAHTYNPAHNLPQLLQPRGDCQFPV
jgi:hypothetical protein